MHENPIRYHEAWQKVCVANGILVPGGFGSRGVEGKIQASKWAREHKIPYLGVCLGLHRWPLSDFSRRVLGMSDAESSEFNPDCANPVVVFMPEIG